MTSLAQDDPKPQQSSFFKSFKRKLSKPQQPAALQKQQPSAAASAQPQEDKDAPPQDTPQPEALHDCSFKVAVAEDYNLKYRQSMEDTHVYIYNFCDVPDAGFFAVFDGHAGAQAAKWCSEHLHNLIRLWILRNEGHLPYPPQLLAKPKDPSAASPDQDSKKPSSKSRWFKKTDSPNTLKSSSIFKTGPSPLTSSSANSNTSRRRSTSVSIASLSSTSPSSSSSSSLASHLAVKENQYPNIPPHQSIPRAFNAAFLEADSRMAEVVPASTGTTAALAVIRWETPDPPAQPELPVKEEDETESGKADETPSSDGSEKQQLHLTQPSAPSEHTDPSDPTLHQPPDILVQSEAPQPPAATSLPLSKVVTNKSVVSRKSFNHSVAPSSRNRVLYTANVGDARIVLCRAGRAFRLSYDHKGSDPVEAARITAAGGLMIANRVNGMLAVTRALGDKYMKSLVSGSPYTTRTVLGPTDEFIIVACDGLWDVCTDQQAVDLARDIMDPKDAARTLVRHAIDSYSSDNVTCMVIRLDPTVCESSLSSSIRED